MAPTKRRHRWRWVGGVLLSLVMFGAIVFFFVLVPCWPSYRTPASSRAACLAAGLGSTALDHDLPRIGLPVLDWAWAHGERNSWVVTSAVTARLRQGPEAEVEPWLERADTVHVSLEELDGEVGAEGLWESPRYLAWRANKTVGHSIGSGLGRAPLESAGFRPEALQTLLRRAKETRSSALVLVKDGGVVGEWYFGGATRRTETMSATKPIAALAIGFLVADGTIESVDKPISYLFPQWAKAQGLDSRVTLRHVLTHTSGLKAQRSVIDFIWRDDFVKAAVDSPVITEPGTVSFYNNKAVNLLSGVVRAVSGKPLDALLDERLFGPLGVDAWNWQHDPSGNPHAMSGLELHALDLAKVGVMLADGGLWQGRRLLPEEWIVSGTRPSVAAAPSWGSLFYLHARTEERTLSEADVERWRQAGVDEAVVRKLAPLVGQCLDKFDWWTRATELAGAEAYSNLQSQGLLPDIVRSPEMAGFSAVGSYGIHLTVYPDRHLVAVRLAPGVSDEEEFPEFPFLVRRLFEAPVR